jgi:hypothetical protein
VKGHDGKSSRETISEAVASTVKVHLVGCALLQTNSSRSKME